MTAYSDAVPKGVRYLPFHVYGETPYVRLITSTEDQYDRAARWMEEVVALAQKSDDLLGDHKPLVFDLAWLAFHAPCHDEPPAEPIDGVSYLVSAGSDGADR